jgi:hypothetical protein
MKILLKLGGLGCGLWGCIPIYRTIHTMAHADLLYQDELPWFTYRAIISALIFLGYLAIGIILFWLGCRQKDKAGGG